MTAITTDLQGYQQFWRPIIIWVAVAFGIIIGELGVIILLIRQRW